MFLPDTRQLSPADRQEPPAAHFLQFIFLLGTCTASAVHRFFHKVFGGVPSFGKYLLFSSYVVFFSVSFLKQPRLPPNIFCPKTLLHGDYAGPLSQDRNAFRFLHLLFSFFLIWL